MSRSEFVRAVGHEHVSADHESTFELTTDDYLTPAGDCILGIEADRSPADFSASFVEACRDADAAITATIEVADRTVTITGRGDPELTFENDRSMVGRTSTYVDDRTIMVEADAAAADIDDDIVDALADGGSVTMELRVE
ncbi:DUF371 domain-containing protein [Halanaeroarchaeum sulfurireducens]|uniref:DUF371 domain-containing protein n=1 Tax=Halanaeroarchaeum sulfurireducens TaxID=1604004 RepID=A0A0F7P7R0_9EURY|nr:DUF371 domain-containing protein [Halanaeroarchaeum sulfurireducens]AKH97181.1 hypothetical protein HLASF_0685 [Halanaeroarchaeum sulfurireducens]